MDREQIVRRILEMRAAGTSYPDIARTLQAEGIPTFSGRGEWRKQTVHKIVQKAGPVELEKVGKSRKVKPRKKPDAAGKSQIPARLTLETELAEALRGKSEAEKRAGKIKAENTRLRAEMMKAKELVKVGKSEIARLSGVEAENAELREKLKKAGGKSAAFEAEVRERIRQIEAERRENSALRDKVAELEKLVKSQDDTQPALFQDAPKHITVNGQRWGIQRKKVGKYLYFYAFKRIRGHHHSVALGKDFDEARAGRKVRAKMEKLRAGQTQIELPGADPEAIPAKSPADVQEQVIEIIRRNGGHSRTAQIWRCVRDAELAGIDREQFRAVVDELVRDMVVELAYGDPRLVPKSEWEKLLWGEKANKYMTLILHK